MGEDILEVWELPVLLMEGMERVMTVLQEQEEEEERPITEMMEKMEAEVEGEDMAVQEEEGDIRGLVV